MTEKMAVHFSSDQTEWETPPELFKLLDTEFHFTLDAAARIENRKCKFFIDPEQNAFHTRWSKLSEGMPVWLNPPYGREVGRWVKRAWEQSTEGEGCTVVLLLPARTDTRWFHDFCVRGEVRFLRGRLKFLERGERRDAAPFPNMVVVFGYSPGFRTFCLDTPR